MAKSKTVTLCWPPAEGNTPGVASTALRLKWDMTIEERQAGRALSVVWKLVFDAMKAGTGSEPPPGSLIVNKDRLSISLKVGYELVQLIQLKNSSDEGSNNFTIKQVEKSKLPPWLSAEKMQAISEEGATALSQ